MKILVLGHFAIDVYHGSDGKEERRHGGIWNSVSALSVLCSKDDKVVPVCGVGKDEYDNLLTTAKSLGNVDTAGLFVLDSPTQQVHYMPGQQAPQCSVDIAPAIRFDRIKKHLNVDGIIVNMSSGMDIDVDTLDQVRLEVRPKRVPMLFDYNNLTLGVDEKKERFRRPVEYWRRWVFMTEYVQLNEEEIKSLDSQKLSEEQLVGHLLTLSVKTVLVTRGRNGASVFFSDHKKAVRKDIDGITENGRKDRAVGAGDTFGAAFMYRMLVSDDITEAARFANAVAANMVATGKVNDVSIPAGS